MDWQWHLHIVAGLTGVLTNAVSIFSTYEYQKETIRGGGQALVDSTSKNENAKDGLYQRLCFKL